MESTLCVWHPRSECSISKIRERYLTAAWLISTPCTAPCFAQTSNAKLTSVLMKNYISCLTLPGQPHRSKEHICGRRLLSQFLLLLYFCLMIKTCKINEGWCRTDMLTRVLPKWERKGNMIHTVFSLWLENKQMKYKYWRKVLAWKSRKAVLIEL